MSKLRELKNKGQLQKVELFPELKWLESRWNDKQEKIVVYVTQEYYDMLKEKYKIEELKKELKKE